MLTRDEILAIYAQGPEAVVGLIEALSATYEGALATVQERLQALEARLALDSHNSAQPPSRDQPRSTPKPQSLRQPSGRSPGGQPGHPGTTLARSATPEVVVTHRPASCAHCQTPLALMTVVGRERRQVVDLPPLRLLTTEHVVEICRCAVCGQLSQGAFPAAAVAPVSYGPRLRSLAVYLNQYQLLPAARAAELLRALFACTLSPGTLATMVADSHTALATTAPAIQQALGQAPVLHADETGVRVGGGQQWLHVASTDRLTHYAVQPGRRAELMAACGVLPGFRGVAVHDGQAAYYTFPCAHALCNVHHLRELIFVAEHLQQGWAGELKALLLEMKAAVEAARAAGERHLGWVRLALFVGRYRRLVQQGVDANPPAEKPPDRPGPPKRTKAGKLALRLARHAEAVLRFLHDFTVPFDNNQAERDLRMVKVQQKVSGCFRTSTGATQFCRIRGYLSTARKQGHSPLVALEAVFAGQPLVLT